MSSDKYKKTSDMKNFSSGGSRRDSGRSEPLKNKVRNSQVSTDSSMPDDFEFFWSIDDVGINDCRPGYVKAIRENEDAAYWFPPTRRGDFIIRAHERRIYRWSAGNSTVFTDTGKLKNYSVASVFIQARQDNFVATDIDCARDNVKDLDYGWSQIKFCHHKDARKGLSEVGFFHRFGEHFFLAVPADGSSWMPQVIPEVYNRPKNGPRAYQGDVPSTSGLCGNLALIIAMAAFSVHERFAESIIAQCFGLRRWRKHNSAHGRYDERGVIAKIYLRSSKFDTSAKHLKNFEEGHYGAIFEVGPSARILAPSNPLPASGGTSAQATTTSYGNPYVYTAVSSTESSGQYARQIIANPPLPSTGTINYNVYRRAPPTQLQCAPPGYTVPLYPSTDEYVANIYEVEDEDEDEESRADEQQATRRVGGSSSKHGNRGRY